MTTVTAEERRARRVPPEPVVLQVLPALAVQRAQPVVAALEARAVAPVARAPRVRQVLQAPRVRLAQRVQRARVAAMKPTPARMRRTPRNRVSVGGLVRRGPVSVGASLETPCSLGASPEAPVRSPHRSQEQPPNTGCRRSVAVPGVAFPKHESSLESVLALFRNIPETMGG